MKIIYSEGTISPEEVIRFLVFTGQADAIFSEIIKGREAQKKAGECNIEVSDEQLQQWADSFRTMRRLYSAEDMGAFLHNNGLTDEDFERFCETSFKTTLLKDLLADDKKIEDYYINNRAEFDYARISIIVVRDETLANEILIQVKEEDEDFHRLARTHSLDEATKFSGGYVGLVPRRMLPPEVSAKVFSGTEGEVIGPFQNDNSFQLILIEEILRASLNDRTRETVKEVLSKLATVRLAPSTAIKPFSTI